MKCSDRFNDILHLDELTEEGKSELEAHLRECRVCAARLAKARASEDRIAQSLAQPEVTPDIVETVMSHVAGEQTGPARRLVPVYAAGLLAAACLLLFVVIKAQHLPTPARERPLVKQAAARSVKQVDRLPRQTAQRQVPQPSVQVKKICRQKSILRRLRFGNQEHLTRKTRPANGAGEIDLCIELRIEDNAGKIVIAAGETTCVLESEIRHRTVPMPADEGESNVDRPPLRTVVSVNPAAGIISQM